MAEPFHAMNIFARSNPSHSVDAVQVFCGFPLSEPYQLMPRLFLYLLLWLAFWSRTALVVVMAWTSVAAVHVVAMAKNHSYVVLDLDMFPAYSQVLLGMIFAPAFIILSRGLKKSRRVDILPACLWMLLLWVAMVSYVSTTRFQPRAVSCLDVHGRNISSGSLLSQCAFQCPDVTTSHPMRSGQSAALATVPSAFWTGRGNTDRWVIFWTVFIAGFMVLAFWMASKDSFVKYTRERVKEAKTKQQKEDATRMLLLAPKAAFFGFIIVVWLGEDAFKHLPPHENKDSISQWGPLVALALAFIGFLLRCFSSSGSTSPSNPKTTKSPDSGGAADLELGSAQDEPVQQPAKAHVTD